jgi:hypothetical protein
MLPLVAFLPSIDNQSNRSRSWNATEDSDVTDF